MNPNTVEPDIAAALAAEAEAASGASNKIKVKIGDQNLEFNDATEVQNAMVAMIERSRSEHEAQEAAKAELRAQLNRQPQAVTPQVVREEDQPLDKEKFAKLLTEDTAKALDYGYRKTESYKQMHQLLQQQQQAQFAATAQMEFYKFADTNKDFPVEDVSSRQTLGQIMQANNLPFTSQGLTMAWNFAEKQGILRPRNVEEATASGGGDPLQPQQNVYQTQPPNLRQAPPTLRRGANSQPDFAAMELAAESMDPAKLKAFINSRDPNLSIR